MPKIIQKITNFPTPPDSSNDTPTEFNTKADAFVNHQGNTYTTEVNTWATQANGLKDDMNAIKDHVDGAVAVLPSGTINDAIITTTNAWSATKIQNNLVALVITSGTVAGKGYWTRFPDGTLIQYYVIVVKNDGTTNWNFPTLFKDANYSVTASPGLTSLNNIMVGVSTKTNATCGVTQSYSGDLSIHVQAIGRWK